MNFSGTNPDNHLRSQEELLVWLLLTKINNALLAGGVLSFVVGGFIRDLLLGRATVDVDIAVRADALQVAAEIADVLGGNFIPLDRENGVARVVVVEETASTPTNQWTFDFSTFEGTIEQDLARRDFTVDAMAVGLNDLLKYVASLPSITEKVDKLVLPGFIDPFHGRDDLLQKKIRAVDDQVFITDAARLLRAVRLAVELGFDIDQATGSLIRRDSSLISAVAGERVREELLRLLLAGQSEKMLLYLDDSGLLTAIFPEMVAAKGVEQPAEHFWTVFDHSLRTLVAVDFLLRQGTWPHTTEKILDSVAWSKELAQYFNQEVSYGSTRRSLIKLAALLHDVAKPQTKVTDDSGRMRFLGHPRQGAAIVTDILTRLRFSIREMRLIETLVAFHLRPTQLTQDTLPTNRAVYRYFRDTGDAAIDVLFLNLADHLATRGPDLIPANWQEHTQLVDYLLSRHFQEDKVTHPPKLVDGHDLIRSFKMKPGPAMGEVIEAIREAQAAGEINTRQSALAFVKKWLNSQAS